VHAINVRFLTSLHEHQRRPVTLRTYARELNRFWTWALGQGIRHPAQVSPEAVKSYLRAQRRKGRDADAIDSIQVLLRGYFDWLRRERLVLARPIPPRDRPRLRSVRVCERAAFEKLITAMGAGVLPPREALVLYLLVFHALRNHEVVGATAIGFRTHGSLATFDIELPAPVLSVGRRHVARGRVLHLPTGRHAWLHGVVMNVVAERAALLKRPDNLHLLVSASWRQGGHPMDSHVVNRLVARATRAVLGTAMTPTLVRQSAGAYLADRSDHTICCAMGWSPGRAVDLAYATREVVPHAVSATC
jgi:site-specific recombinase XerC